LKQVVFFVVLCSRGFNIFGKTQVTIDAKVVVPWFCDIVGNIIFDVLCYSSKMRYVKMK